MVAVGGRVAGAVALGAVLVALLCAVALRFSALMVCPRAVDFGFCLCAPVFGADERAFADFVCPGADAFPRATPLPGTLTPRGANCPRRLPGCSAAGRVAFAGFLSTSLEPATPTPPATPAAATTAAALRPSPPARMPPVVPVAVTPVPTPAATATDPAPALMGRTAADALPSRPPLNKVSDSGMGTRARPRRDQKSTRLNSSHGYQSRMPSSA